MYRESNIDESHGKPSNFRGLVLTGWSRYDHFAVLCELLPVALPSLILNLVIVTQGAHDYEAAKKAHRILQCNNQKPLFTAQELRRNPQQWDAHRILQCNNQNPLFTAQELRRNPQ